MRVILFALILVISFGVSHQSHAQWKEHQQGRFKWKTYEADPLQARFYELKNGFKVFLAKDVTQPRIYTYIPVRAGSNTDPATHTGLAHYLEHMLFKGSESFGTVDYAKEKPYLDQIDRLFEKYNQTKNPLARKKIYREIDSVSGLAAQWAIGNEYDKMMADMGAKGTNAFTWYEQTVYLEDIPSNAIDRFLKVQAERFSKPVFRIFHTELEAVYEEKNRSLDEDDWKSYEVMMKALFPTHNYGQQTTIGTIEHLKNPSLLEIKKYFKKFYVPANMALVMVGDFDFEEVIEKIDNTIGQIPSADFKIDYQPKPEKPLLKPIIKTVTGPNPANVMIGYRIPSVLDPSYPIAYMVSKILYNGQAGLLDQNLNQPQLVLESNVNAEFLKDYSVISLLGRPLKGQKLEATRALLLKEIEKLKAGKFSDQLMKAIILNAEREQLEKWESQQGKASELMESFILSRGENYPAVVGFIDRLKKVSRDQVIDFAKKYFSSGSVTVYKKTGIDPSGKSVEKPAITPVSLNATAQSDFLKSVNSMPMPKIESQYLIPGTDFKDVHSGPIRMLIRKEENPVPARINLHFKKGKYHEKWLPLALDYFKFCGTTTKSAKAISQEFYSKGIQYQMGCDEREVIVSITGLASKMEEGIVLFQEWVKQVIPDESAFKQLIANELEERENNKQDKDQLLEALTDYALYGDDNPTKFIPDNQSLKAVKSRFLLNLVQSLLQDSLTITASSNEDILSMQTMLSKAWTNNLSPSKSAQLHVFTPRTIKEEEVYFTTFDMVQSEIKWVRSGTSLNQEILAKAQLFNQYFGGGMASIVFQTLRESKALAYSTYADYTSPRYWDHPFTFQAYIGCQADKFHEAIQGMDSLINYVPTNTNLLNTCKESLLKIKGSERYPGIQGLERWLAWEKQGFNQDPRTWVMTQLPSLSFESLKPVWENGFSGKPMAKCVIASPKKIKDTDLQRYGKVTKLTAEQILGY